MSKIFLTDEVQGLNEEQKARARANIGAAAEGEGGNSNIPAEAVLYVKQELKQEEQAQARKNISVESNFYSTEREKLAVTLGKENAVPNDITSAAVWGLYDALAAKYPDRVQKNEIHNNDGSFTSYEYVISSGEYNPETGLPDSWVRDNIKKPTYLVLSGIHGNERQAIVSTYRFIRDVVSGYNIPEQFREGCMIRVVPVGNPWSLDHNSRFNESEADINRDFYSQTPQKETQALQSWLNSNRDAELFLDMHNGRPFAAVVFAGLTDFEDDKPLKKVAMRGVERVIPFWRDVIGYDDDVVFYMATSLDATGANEGMSYDYAFRELGIPSLGVELAFRQNISEKDALNSDGSIKIDKEEITDETPAASAEIIGNVLIEFYKQYFMGKVVDMTETNAKLDELSGDVSEGMSSINEKLDMLLGGSVEPTNGFRSESGSMVLDANALPASGKTTIAVDVPCSDGAKICVFMPDDKTLSDILATDDGTKWLVGFIGQVIVQIPFGANKLMRYWSYAMSMNDNIPSHSQAMAENTDGFRFGCNCLKKGTYNWTAYYWNEPKQEEES